MAIFSNLKSLPKKSKRLLILGITLALFVALPLFVWSVVNMKFDLRKKAQGVVPLIPKTVKVMVLEFNPILLNHENKKLSEYENWSIPTDLEISYIQKLKTASDNYADYQISQRIVIDNFPELNDGFKYTENSYLDCLSSNSNCHNPWLVDYNKIISDYGICDKVNANEIDEVWLWGGPWFGYWEAVMAGPDAFITNAPPITNTTCSKQLHIMGFNYERGVAEMLEDFGHRFEGTMYHTFTANGINLWSEFTKYESSNPGDANCGKVHFPPNATVDYDWANNTSIENSCEDWLNYPNLTEEKEAFSCQRWGCTALNWIEYWLNHIPKYSGYTNNTWDNWWKYVLDYELAIVSSPSPTPTDIAATPTDQGSSEPTPTATSTSIATTTATATPTQAPVGGGEPNYCGGTCGSNYNCRANFFCYQGYCRNPLCASDSDCNCSTPTATATAKTTTTATAKATSTSSPKGGNTTSSPSYPRIPTMKADITTEPIAEEIDETKPENKFFAKYALPIFAVFALIVISTIYYAVKKNNEKIDVPHITPPVNI